MADYKFFDNSKEIKQETAKKIKVALRLIGGQAEKYAKQNETAVDTGRLRNSITYALSGEPANTETYTGDDGYVGQYVGVAPDDDDAVYVGTNVEYAQIIEERGGIAGRGKDYLRNAVLDHTDGYKKILKAVMKDQQT